jgi:hypothetical protein
VQKLCLRESCYRSAQFAVAGEQRHASFKRAVDHQCIEEPETVIRCQGSSPFKCIDIGFMDDEPKVIDRPNRC